jgi:hypothetical protein
MNFLAFILLTVTLASGEDKSVIEFKFPGGIDRVTYDPERIQSQELNQIMELSPVLGNDNFMIVPETIELCVANNPQYRKCSSNGNVSVQNAETNLTKISTRIDKLDHERYPGELVRIVEYLRKLQSLWLWKEQKVLAFWKSNDPRVLESGGRGPETFQQCDTVLQKIQSSTDVGSRFRLARVEWSNCIWDRAKLVLGPYPIEDWKAFLESRGVTEEKIVTEEE